MWLFVGLGEADKTILPEHAGLWKLKFLGKGNEATVLFLKKKLTLEIMFSV